MDRLHAVNYQTLLNKKVVLLTTFGDIDETSAGVMNIVQSMEMLSKYLGMELIQNLNISTNEKPVTDNVQAKRAAYTLGTEIIKQ